MNYSRGAILYWVEGEMYDLMREFEKKHHVMVYHIIENYTDFGRLLSFLYVSESKDEWEYDRNDLTEGYALAYVKNMDDDKCSEFGSIFIEDGYGGLVRTAKKNPQTNGRKSQRGVSIHMKLTKTNIKEIKRNGNSLEKYVCD